MFPKDTRILIVDDMSSMREQLKDQLIVLGYKILHFASSGKEGLETLDKQLVQTKPIQLVFSDWYMPEMTGLDFLKAVRNRDVYKSLPFIMVTTENESPNVMKAILVGVSNYVIKPITRRVLEDKLKSLWAKQNSSKS